MRRKRNLRISKKQYERRLKHLAKRQAEQIAKEVDEKFLKFIKHLAETQEELPKNISDVLYKNLWDLL